jgi:aconitate hydratase
MDIYLRATKRGLIADLANQYIDLLVQDQEIEEVVENREEYILKYFDRLIEIDLSKLEPHIVGPHTPDLARPISKMAKDVKNNSYIDTISVALIGSCTNSSYEDMSRAADIAEQARARGIKTRVPLQVTPGSEMVRATTERDGQIHLLKEIGANVLANALVHVLDSGKDQN